jgi:hypothetical protein
VVTGTAGVEVGVGVLVGVVVVVGLGVVSKNSKYSPLPTEIYSSILLTKTGLISTVIGVSVGVGVLVGVSLFVGV